MPQAKNSFKLETDVINFGSHRGKTIGHVMKNDISWITWALKSVKGFKLYQKLHQTYLDELKKKTNG